MDQKAPYIHEFGLAMSDRSGTGMDKVDLRHRI